jgi:hypothetical protein
MFAAYNSQGGVQIAPDTTDPYDRSNFPSSQYPYAFDTFGNNGTTPHSGGVTNAANHSLDDLTNTVPNAATIYSDILLTGSGSTFIGSDHYPIVGDYNVVTPPPAVPVLSSVILTNHQIQFTTTGTAGTNYAIEANTNIATSHWTAVVTNASPFTFKATNSSPQMFYRARAVL